jgi:uncharacterized repeat protein (TIGR01451 family)
MRRRYVFLAAALLALVFGVSVGVAKSGPGQVRVAIVSDSFNPACPGGFGAKNKKIGTATAIREKGLATLRGQLHGAVPGGYVVNLYDADCNFLIELGSFRVDKGGDGNFAKRLVLSFGQGFFLDFYNQDQDIHNSTATFKLGSSGTPPGAPGADLGVTKSVDDSTPNVGETVTFTVRVTNAGPFTATGVTLADVLPAGLTFVSAAASEGSYDAATGVWTVGAVTTGTPQTLTIKATVASLTPGANTATITHLDQPDANPGNNSASVSVHVQSADLAVAKSVSTSTPSVGDNVTFTVTLSDNGPNAATSVTVADPLPAGLGFVSAMPSQGSYNAATGVWTVGTVTTASPRTLALQAKVVSPNPQTNTATITHADQFDPTPGNNSASVTVAPPPATHFEVSAPASATAGQPFTFTVTALDQFNNVAAGYAGTVHFTSTDGQAVLPANTTLSNGSGAFSATLKTAGNQTISATDTADSSITGTSLPIAVAPASATHFAVSARASVAPGIVFPFRVTARDQFNNTATGYLGTVHFTSSDAGAILPADSTLTNGTGIFSATLNTAGNQTITATDTANPAITGTSNTITVASFSQSQVDCQAAGGTLTSPGIVGGIWTCGPLLFDSTTFITLAHDCFVDGGLVFTYFQPPQALYRCS